MNGLDEKNDDFKNIYVLDFESMKWKQSKITSLDGRSILFSSSYGGFDLDYGNNMDLFIYGYLKSFEIYNLYIPHDIINILKKMYKSEQTIHLLQYNTRYKKECKHFYIDFQDVQTCT